MGGAMFDIGGDEFLLVAVLALLLLGPKELPKVMRFVGQWTGKIRRFSAAFRAGIDTVIRESEVKDLEQGWSAGRDDVLAHLEAEEAARNSAPAKEDPVLQGTIQSPSATTPPGAEASNRTT